MLRVLGRSEDPLSGQNEGSAVVGRECWSDDGLVWRRIKGKLLGNYISFRHPPTHICHPHPQKSLFNLPQVRYVDSGWM